MAHISEKHKKTEELKTKVTSDLYDRFVAIADEDGLMKATLVREAILHYLTMREVKRRIDNHHSSNHFAA